MVFSEWQAAAIAILDSLFPNSMVYTVDWRKMHKAGLEPGAAVQHAKQNRLIHARGSSSAPKPVIYRGAVPMALHKKTKENRRKPYWAKELIEAKCRAAVYAVIVEAETHRLEPDGIAYVREMKAKLLGNA